jgi:hypothetical protein
VGGGSAGENAAGSREGGAQATVSNNIGIRKRSLGFMVFLQLSMIRFVSIEDTPVNYFWFHIGV